MLNEGHAHDWGSRLKTKKQCKRGRKDTSQVTPQKLRGSSGSVAAFLKPIVFALKFDGEDWRQRKNFQQTRDCMVARAGKIFTPSAKRLNRHHVMIHAVDTGVFLNPVNQVEAVLGDERQN